MTLYSWHFILYFFLILFHFSNNATIIIIVFVFLKEFSWERAYKTNKNVNKVYKMFGNSMDGFGYDIHDML